MSVEGRKFVSRSIRLDPELARQVAIAAAERVVSVNWLLERLITEGMERLAPVDEFRITHDTEGASE